MVRPYCCDRNVQHLEQACGRRDFLKAMAAASAVAAVADLAMPNGARAEGKYPSRQALLASMGTERIARFAPLGYQSKPANSNSVSKWVQVDLGQSRPIDQIKLMPMLMNYSYAAAGFPKRFRIDVSQDAVFTSADTIADHTQADYPSPGDKVAIFSGHGVSGRYVRLTATRLTDKQLALSKFEVWSGGQDVAQGCRVTDSDSMEVFNAAAGGYICPAALAHGTGPDQPEYEMLRAIYPAMPAYVTGSPYLGLVAPLTRKPRPQGEGVVTDNPGNIIPAHRWKPVPFQAVAPLRNVQIGEGLFKTVMENNISYLLNSFSVAELLRPFRTRAGKANPP
ncbi:MAG: discoidin domain-containing protein, partial [Phycisphaerae bacterium]